MMSYERIRDEMALTRLPEWFTKGGKRKVRKSWVTARRLDGTYIHYRRVRADRWRNWAKAYELRCKIPNNGFSGCDKIVW